MNNDIISFLNFNSDEITVTKVEIDQEKMIKYVHVIKKLEPTYCPLCGFRMHSKGISVRSVNHSILQDGYKVVLRLSQRRWKCTSPICGHTMTDEFTFVQRYKHNSNHIPFLILKNLKNLNVTAADAARTFNVSDTYVHNIVLTYLNCTRRPLPEILSVDEVHLEFDSHNKYALVLMDFITGEIIDILPNRLKKDYNGYFYRIPLEERNRVKAVVCDMYNPYVSFCMHYFHNAVAVIDSFHVMQWMNHKIDLYILKVKKQYQMRDNEELEKENYENNRENRTGKVSREVYLLNKHKWVLLRNRRNMEYDTVKHYKSQLGMAVDTFDIEKMFFSLDRKFPEIREMKYRYEEFNDSFPMPADEALVRLEKIIETYKGSSCDIFRDFAVLLERYKKEIANSFTDPGLIASSAYEDEFTAAEETLRRISNGPMEGFNRKPKDLKRNSRGFTNIEYTISRILWSNRKDEAILSVPKKEKDVHTFTGEHRGSYKKHKK